jgi:hypothetical protein
LASEIRNAGYHTVVWDGNDDTGRKVPTGVYFYRLETDEFHAVRKLVKLE